MLRRFLQRKCLAQLVKPQIENLSVPSSIPGSSTEIPEEITVMSGISPVFLINPFYFIAFHDL